jgi:transcriptional regulator with XRE-family HTH domain
VAIQDKFREYREDVLGIKQKEMAYRLGVDPAVLSNYELGKRDFPNDLLVMAKEVFGMTDEHFLAMMLGRPYGGGGRNTARLLEEAREAQARYYASFAEAYGEVIEQSGELRELIAFVSGQDPKTRKEMLSVTKRMLDIFKDMNRGGHA